MKATTKANLKTDNTFTKGQKVTTSLEGFEGKVLTIKGYLPKAKGFQCTSKGKSYVIPVEHLELVSDQVATIKEEVKAVEVVKEVKVNKVSDNTDLFDELDLVKNEHGYIGYKLKSAKRFASQQVKADKIGEYIVINKVKMYL